MPMHEFGRIGVIDDIHGHGAAFAHAQHRTRGGAVVANGADEVAGAISTATGAIRKVKSAGVACRPGSEGPHVHGLRTAVLRPQVCGAGLAQCRCSQCYEVAASHMRYEAIARSKMVACHDRGDKQLVTRRRKLHRTPSGQAATLAAQAHTPRAAIMRIRGPWRPIVLVTTVLCAWLWVTHARSQQDLDAGGDAGEKAGILLVPSALYLRE